MSIIMGCQSWKKRRSKTVFAVVKVHASTNFVLSVVSHGFFPFCFGIINQTADMKGNTLLYWFAC